MATRAIKALLLALVLGASFVAADVAVPQLSARVTDLTGTLAADQLQTLEQTLTEFETRKGSQIVVLIVPSTAPETIEQYGIRVADQWKVGRKGIDDGAILLVAKDDRKVRIEVGYGLEGALPDATAERIISEIIVPRFRQGDFYGGITDGVAQMIKVVDGEPLPPPKATSFGRGVNLHEMTPVVLLLALVVGSFLRRILGKVPGAIVTGGALGFLAWLVSSALVVAIGAGFIAFMITLLSGGMPGLSWAEWAAIAAVSAGVAAVLAAVVGSGAAAAVLAAAALRVAGSTWISDAS